MLATALQVVGAVLLVVGVCFAFGWAVGLIVTGAGSALIGYVLERE
jgi:hypothetical protein